MTDLAEAMAKYFRLPEVAPWDKGPVLARTRRIGRNRGRRLLALVMNDLGLQSGIEIGTHRGESALEWCRAIPGLRLTCVDPYMPYSRYSRRDTLQWYKDVQRTIRESGYNIDLWRMTSRDAVSKFEDESVDFLYIDGLHTFDDVMMDLLQYVQKVRQGGIVALHDYLRINKGGVMEAVDAYTRTHAVAPWYVTYDFAPTAFWQRGAEQA